MTTAEAAAAEEAGAEGGPGCRRCDFCEEERAMVYCRADSARLCLACDRHVHAANTVSSRHFRALLCDACLSAPASILLCSSQRRDGGHPRLLCPNCDFDAALGDGDGDRAGARRPVEPYSGCPTAAEMLALFGVSVEKEKSLSPDGDGSGWFDGSGGGDEEPSLLLAEAGWVWDTPPILSMEDIIVPTKPCHGFQALGVPPPPKDRNAACGKHKDEILRQLGDLVKSEVCVGCDFGWLQADMGYQSRQVELGNLFSNVEKDTALAVTPYTPMGKSSTIESFFKRKNVETATDNEIISKTPKIEIKDDFDIHSLERDPGLRPQIWEYPVNQRDEVRRAYIKFGPYQCQLMKYPKSGHGSHLRSFQASWFKLFPSWLEYSLQKDAAFCLPCYLFHTQDGPPGSNAFTIDGFKNWKKVRDGKNCAFLSHIGKDSSPHRNAEKACEDLMNQTMHIDKNFSKISAQQVTENRLRLKASIDVVRWLAFQGCAFRGHDENITSKNRGNFLELLSFVSSYNDKIAEVVDRAPHNASYTSPRVQKEILQVLSVKVKTAIREEIGHSKFCIIVDEARDESKKEQMSVVLRFVDKDGIVRERFFGLVHVKDTAALTLKEEILVILSRYNLDVQNIRGQGYDGASNMRGEWHGLQALISSVCPYAYYVHCMAHRLQLALVAASKEVISIHHFFNKLTSIINIVGASCKRNDQLKAAHATDIAHLIAINELETGKGLNQIGTLQRAGDTRWSSHLNSVSSLIKMFSATCTVLLNIIDDGATSAQRGDADAAYEALTSYEFVFILHLMKEILNISDQLCQALQRQSQDILNAMHLVSSTKSLIQKLRDERWDELLSTVISFCELRNIDVPDLSTLYISRKCRARHQQDGITLEHHYKVDIFNTVIDTQMQELNNQFNDHVVELLILSSALDPRELSTSFRINDICKLVEKFYPEDFTEQEMLQLRVQLEHFEHVQRHPEFKSLATISDLCQWLVKTRKSDIYPLVYRILTLILTLPVSTATTERSFSAMKIIKNKLRNKMEDDFLSDCLVIYIEKEIAETFSTDSIIDDFRDLKERRVLF